MEFPVDWDVEDYKCAHESREQWDLRKAFMSKWKGHYPEDRLVCLARVFTNIEFLGCRYPLEVMKLVAEMSKEVACDYRESKKKKLQRTFVSASDAAEDRAKGTKRPHSDITGEDKTNKNEPKFKKFVSASTAEEKNEAIKPGISRLNVNSHNVNSHDVVGSYQKDEPPGNTGNFSMTNQQRNNFIPNSNFNQDYGNRNRFQNRPAFEQRGQNYNGQFGRNPGGKNNRDKRGRNNVQEDSSRDTDLIMSKYGKLVLFQRNVSQLCNLMSSCNTCKVPIEFKEEVTATTIKEKPAVFTCSVYVNSVSICKVTCDTKKEAKDKAAATAFDVLKKHCYMIVTKQSHISKEDKKISVTEIQEDKTKTNLESGLETKVDSSVATRMMKMMGWQGGGLGSSADGISEPIAPNLKQIRRAGLGSSGDGSTPGRSIQEAVTHTIEEFASKGSADYDLIFASDFTKDERAAMHRVAQKLGLKTKSYGKDPDRYLVISKSLSPAQLVRSLLSAGGANDKYDLVLPNTS